MATTAKKTTAGRTPEERAAVRATRMRAAEDTNRKRLLKSVEDACKTARQSLEAGDRDAHDSWVAIAASSLEGYVKTVKASSDGATLNGVNRVRAD